MICVFETPFQSFEAFHYFPIRGRLEADLESFRLQGSEHDKPQRMALDSSDQKQKRGFSSSRSRTRGTSRVDGNTRRTKSGSALVYRGSVGGYSAAERYRPYGRFRRRHPAYSRQRRGLGQPLGESSLVAHGISVPWSAMWKPPVQEWRYLYTATKLIHVFLRAQLWRQAL